MGYFFESAPSWLERGEWVGTDFLWVQSGEKTSLLDTSDYLFVYTIGLQTGGVMCTDLYIEIFLFSAYQLVGY